MLLLNCFLQSKLIVSSRSGDNSQNEKLCFNWYILPSLAGSIYALVDSIARFVACCIRAIEGEVRGTTGV